MYLGEEYLWSVPLYLSRPQNLARSCWKGSRRDAGRCLASPVGDLVCLDSEAAAGMRKVVTLWETLCKSDLLWVFNLIFLGFESYIYEVEVKMNEG